MKWRRKGERGGIMSCWAGTGDHYYIVCVSPLYGLIKAAVRTYRILFLVSKYYFPLKVLFPWRHD